MPTPQTEAFPSMVPVAGTTRGWAESTLLEGTSAAAGLVRRLSNLLPPPPLPQVLLDSLSSLTFRPLLLYRLPNNIAQTGRFVRGCNNITGH